MQIILALSYRRSALKRFGQLFENTLLETHPKKSSSVPKTGRVQLLKWLWNISKEPKSSIGLFVQCRIFLLVRYFFNWLFRCNKEKTSGSVFKFWSKESKTFQGTGITDLMLHILSCVKMLNNTCGSMLRTCNGDLVQSC